MSELRRTNRWPWVWGLLLGLTAVGRLTAALTTAQDAGDDPPPDARALPVVASETLGGDARYLAYVDTDKPIYRIGETLHVRGVLLHHASRKPLPGDTIARALVEIKGPKGDVIASGFVPVENSVAGFTWQIPDGQAGGQYTIKMSFPDNGFPPAQRDFDIRAYRAPRLKSQIEFLRDGYGPGDEVVATLHTERAEGGIPEGANVAVVARVDGAEVYRGQTTVDQAGDCTTRFSLPTEIARGEGTLAMIVEDGGVVETASKTIPILLQTVDLTMYPEGGDLVAGLPNRVYFEAFTPAKKPADLAGVVVDSQGNDVTKFRSQHEGRGRFDFTPQTGETYHLQITEPSGINSTYELPAAKLEGVVLRTTNDVYPAGEPVSLEAASTGQPFTVTIRKREQQLAEQSIIDVVAGGTAELKFELPNDADGVLVATAWSEDHRPLAERLIFRQPARMLNIAITADAEQYVPGGRAALTIETADENGEPVSATVGVTVTDDSVLEMIEKREQAPRLPVMVLLENEVRELADAHVYLDSENPEAPRAVDLLLGTQGWRRFAFIDAEKFIAEHGDQARRVLALSIVTRRDSLKLGMLMGGFGGEAVDDRFAGNENLRRRAIHAEPAAPQAAAVPVPEAAPAEGAPPPMNAPAEAAEARREVADFELADEAAGAPADLGDLRANAAKDQAHRPAQPDASSAAPAIASEAKRDVAERQGLARQLDRLEADADAAFFDMAIEEMPVRNDFTPVRVYAHRVRSDRQPGQRSDFTETLFWAAAIQTDERGKATIEFGLNDAVTSFRAAADAFAADGAIGSGTLQIDSVEPFYLEPKLPLEVTMGDVIRSPLGIVNATGTALDPATIRVIAHGSQQTESSIPAFSLAAGERARRLMNIRVGKFNGAAEMTIEAAAGPYRDAVTRGMMVRPLGFPVEFGRGGLIAPEDTITHEFVVPDDLVHGSLQARLVVYPSPLATMTDALERLIREPYGCFEQTSSTTYPLVMAQQYFMSHEGVDPSLIERSAKVLDKGHDRLLGFESPSGGFEWFGGDPGHDALTAYGLMEFTDMAQVRHVDPALLARTKKWLLAQRDGQGGYQRKTHTLHCWLADPEVAYTYDTWGLLAAGTDPAELSREVAWVRDAGEKASNTYVTALAANVLALAGDQDGANHLLDKLAGKQDDDGSLKDATQSVVGSGGEALKIETTSLAVTAWLTNPRYADSVEHSIKYLAESCKAGRFGSTQSTILALKAIVAYDAARATPKADGQLQLLVDGAEIGEPVHFAADSQGVIELPDASELLTPGDHKLQIRMTGGSRMPYALSATYHRTQPESSAECALHLEVALNDRTIDEGAVTEAAVSVINRTGEQLPCPVAIIGVPGGLEVRHDQLKELVEEGRISAYEVLGREVVLYWRSLDAEQRVDLPLSLVAAIPGSYTGPASRAYEYYTDEHKTWVAGLAVEIEPRQQ